MADMVSSKNTRSTTGQGLQDLFDLGRNNYIQSMDLVGRKFTMNKGKALMNLIKEIGTFTEVNQNTEGFQEEFKMFNNAFADFQAILGILRGYMQAGRISMMPLYATRIQHATSLIYSGMLLLDQALLANKTLQEIGDNHYDSGFYKSKIATAKFYVMNAVPQIFTIKRVFEAGDTSFLLYPPNSCAEQWR
jgi:hypothetical protein